jgi:hypothetical protein
VDRKNYFFGIKKLFFGECRVNFFQKYGTELDQQIGQHTESVVHEHEMSPEQMRGNQIREQLLLGNRIPTSEETADLKHFMRADAETPVENTRLLSQEAKIKSAQIEQDLNGKKIVAPGLAEESPSVKDELVRVQGELSKMQQAVTAAGLSASVQKSVQDAIHEQTDEIEQQGRVDSANEKNRKERIFAVVQREIQEEIRLSTNAGAEQMRKVIDRAEEVLLPIAKSLGENIAADCSTKSGDENEREHSREFWETILEKRTVGFIQKARKMCELAESDLSDKQILQKELHALDIGETDDEKDIENSKKVIDAMLSYTEKINEEAAAKKAEQSENRRYLQEKLAPYFKKQKGERFDDILGEIEEIAEQANIEARYIQESLATGELPELHAYKVVQDWAREHGVSFLRTTEIIKTLAPASEVIFMERKDFLQKALKHQYPDEAKTLAKWYKNRPATFARRFAQSGGNLRQYLLQKAEEDIQSASNLVMNQYEEELAKEETQGAFHTAKEAVHPLTDAVQEYIPRATKLVADLEKIRVKIQGNEETKNASDEIFRTQRMLRDMVRFAEQPEEKNGSADAGFLEYVQELIGQASQKLSDPNQIQATLEEFFRTLEKKRDELKDKNPEDLKELLKTEAFSFEKNEHANALLQKGNEAIEKQESVENERKEKLQRFADWVVGKESIHTNEVWGLVDSLENLNGRKVLQKLTDEDFDKRFGKKTKARVEFQNGMFEIFVRESDWNFQSRDVLTSLCHEGFHTLDAANKKAFSQELDQRLKGATGFDYKKFKEEFCKLTNTTPNKFADEIFAYMMAGDDDPKISAKLSEIPADITNEFYERRDEFAEDFANKGIRGGLFGGKRALHRNAAAEISFDPVTKDHWKQDLQTQISRLGTNIDSLKKSNARAEKKGEFIKALDGLLGQFIDESSQPITDEDVFDDLMERINKANGEAESAIIALAENQQSERGLFLSIWDNTEILSISDIISMFNTTKEFIIRRYNRNQKLRTGKAGKAIFDKLVPNLANEFDLQQEQAESEEVKNYENGLENKDPWQIMDRLDETRNKDELKACLNVLSHEGQIDWYDQRIWKALERVGSGINIYDADANDIRALKTKLQRACSILWDADYFNDTDRANGSNYRSGKANYDAEIEGNVQEMGGMLESLLKQKRHGYKVDPQRFEAYLDKCVKIGKSTPEDIFWFILQGVHHGILNMERINFLNSEYLNTYPAMDWFYRRKPKLAEIRSYASMFPPTASGGPPDSFLDWFMSTVMSDKAVIQRTIKNATTARDSFDHDWSATLLSVGDTSMAWQLLRKDNEFTALHLTAYSNMTVGQITYITNLARYRNRFDKEHLKSEIIRHLSYSSVISTALKGNYTGDKVHNLTTELDQPARQSSDQALYMSDKPLTTREILNSSESILKALDPRVFWWIGEENISDRPGSVENEKAQEIIRKINQVAGYEDLDLSHVKSGHQLLDNLSVIIDRALDVNPDGIDRVVDQALRVYNSHHKEGLNLNRIDV